MNKEERTEFELGVLELLKNVMDPEIEVNIVDLGLIYELVYDGEKKIDIKMTFSTPSCPLGDSIVNNVKEVIRQKYPDIETEIEIVFDPPWSAEMISEEGRQMLGL